MRRAERLLDQRLHVVERLVRRPPDEQAAPAELLPLLLPAYGLTLQERRVTELVCRGLSTIEIARQLHVTTNTVQDHLKSIFSKSGVHSRRQLVATLLKQQYH